MPSESRCGIMWTSTRAADMMGHFLPNHFVPLLPITDRDIQDAHEMQTSEITSGKDVNIAIDLEVQEAISGYLFL